MFMSSEPVRKNQIDVFDCRKLQLGDEFCNAWFRSSFSPLASECDSCPEMLH
jgi:hypothetical protein